jgi:rod shape-determining protein MreC
MTKFQTRSLLVVTLVLASLALILYGRLPVLEPVRSALQLPLNALQRSISTLWGRVSNRTPNVGTDPLSQRLIELENENEQLRNEVARLKQIEAEANSLGGLVDYARVQPENKYLAANVIARDPSPFLNWLILNRGSDSGVNRDMPVVTGKGLVGRVVEVSAVACKVQPITDPAVAVAARLQTSREPGVILGQVGGGLEMQFITQNVRVDPGEVVVTSGLGGLYPPGIILGTVSAVQKQDFEVLQKADITPAVDLQQLEIVLIITNFQPADLGPFSDTEPTPTVP